MAEAARLLGIHRNTLVRSWFKEKRLIKLVQSPTGHWFVEVREMERVLRSRQVQVGNGGLPPGLLAQGSSSKVASRQSK
ncbi:hypothetical protein HUU05_14210 [candidate division KSB1 bacterium]|nr:hypothetical protein [candidate division KSB1 bacterium]